MNRLIRGAAALLLVAATVTPAHAISRVRADQNSCAVLQQKLVNEGAVVIRYPSTRVPNYFLYDRYVSPNTRCSLGEELKAVRIPAADNSRCLVHHCKRAEPRFIYQDD